MKRRDVWIWTAALISLALVAPYFLYPVFLMQGLCMALFACAFDLLLGYVGLLSFGHAAFMGSAAYITAHVCKVWGFPPELGIICGVAVAATLGAVFGILAIRRQGIYFAMITLALSQMLYFFCVEAPFTGGEDGIQQVPRGYLLGFISLNNDMAMYWVVAAVFVAGFLLVHRIIHSPFGQVLKAIRENEPRAISLGYRVDDYKLLAFVLSAFLAGFALIQRTVNSPFGQVIKAIRENEPRATSLGYRAERYKLLAFVLSAALAGLAGATKALVLQFASLTDVDWTTSGAVVLMTLVGGVGTPLGPVVGAFIIVTMENYLAQTGSWVTIIEGVIFVVCVLTFRRGIVGVIAPYVTGKIEPKMAEPSPEPS